VDATGPEAQPSVDADVAGAWELSGIMTLQSGDPLTILAGTDVSLTRLGQERRQEHSGMPQERIIRRVLQHIEPCEPKQPEYHVQLG